ncbi:phage holin family protein [Hyphomicrobiales bacterium BP6-180914]|uniref:Phage holin family protein n=2 Tax=Lichenifustis flavocetrariae TaxID=2949735 RepID=A0AA41Z331_9HYPH|nr:phage holin family protein [Lichenifustis flavocetrariae]
MARLIETEIRLVRTELGEKLAEAIRALAIIAASSVLLLTALVLFVLGVVHLLIYFGLQPFVAFFSVGLVSAVVGGLAVYFAVSHLSTSGLAPKRSINQLGKDAQIIKEQVS